MRGDSGAVVKLCVTGLTKSQSRRFNKSQIFFAFILPLLHSSNTHNVIVRRLREIDDVRESAKTLCVDERTTLAREQIRRRKFVLSLSSLLFF